MLPGAVDYWTMRVIEALDARFPEGRHWDVLGDQRAPAPMSCISFATVGMAHAALTAAGFGPTRFAIQIPPLAPFHDQTTTLKYGHPNGALVVVARRLVPTV